MRKIEPTPDLTARLFAKIGVRSVHECWPYLGLKNKKGYGQIGLNNEMVTATHVALTISGLPRPSMSHWALHHCDNPCCCNPTHLYWGTVRDNNLDRDKRGRCGAKGGRGTGNGAAKLNDDKVRLIRSSSLGTTELARQLGVSHGSVHKVRKFKTWTHVT